MRTRTLREAILLAAGILAMQIFIPAGPAGAAEYPPAPCTDISVSTTAPFPGQQILVTGSGFAPQQQVTLVLDSPTVTLAQVTADASGSFSTEVTIPLSPTGRRVLTASGAPGNCPAIAVELVVRGTSPSQTSHGPTSQTGTNIAAGVLAGIVLIIAGLLLLRGGRARSRQRAAH